MTPEATLVVPCFNEAQRLDVRAFDAFVATEPGITILFVNDGSTDHTGEVLAGLHRRTPARIDVLTLERNVGKGEAVRRGLLQAFARGSQIVGYLDADLATPLEEVKRLLDVLRRRHGGVLLGARVSLLGREIQRTAIRHYLGRIFASVASVVLQVPVYDTQCGAKFFWRSASLEAAVAQPFLTRWLFDVELLGRLLAPAHDIPALRPGDIVEEPLHVWRDIPGSKVRPKHFLIAIVDMTRIAIDMQQRRRQAVAAR